MSLFGCAIINNPEGLLEAEFTKKGRIEHHFCSMNSVSIVFIEVKTGRSVLSARERAVKKAVEEKKVSWRVFNPDLEIDHQRIPTTSKGSPLGVRAAAL